MISFVILEEIYIHIIKQSQKGCNIMPIKYKINIVSALKEAGYSTYRLRKEKLLSESTIQKFRDGDLVSWENLSTICKLLNCQPGDLVEYSSDDNA